MGCPCPIKCTYLPEKCCSCGYPAKWHVWYVGFVLDFGYGNLAYDSLCSNCLARALKHGYEGRQVDYVQRIKLVEDALSGERRDE